MGHPQRGGQKEGRPAHPLKKKKRKGKAGPELTRQIARMGHPRSPKDRGVYSVELPIRESKQGAIMTTRDDIEKDKPENQQKTEESAHRRVLPQEVQSPYRLNRTPETTNADAQHSIPALEVVAAPLEDRKGKNWKWALFAELMIETAKIMAPESAGEQGAQIGTSISKSLPPAPVAKQYWAVRTAGANEAAEEADRFWTAVGPVIDAVAKEQPDPPESKIHETKEYVKEMAKGAGAEFKEPNKLGHTIGHEAVSEGVKHSLEAVITVSVAAWEARKLKKAGGEKKNDILSRSGEICEKVEELLKNDPTLPLSAIAVRCGCSEETVAAAKTLLEEVRGDSTRAAKA